MQTGHHQDVAPYTSSQTPRTQPYQQTLEVSAKCMYQKNVAGDQLMQLNCNAELLADHVTVADRQQTLSSKKS